MKSPPPEAQPLKNAYTHAPELQPQLVLGSLQLLFWLFCHPSAWHNYLARLDSTLPPNFCLAELNRAQWQNPALRRLLLRGYVVWPLLVGLLLALWAATSDNPAFWVRLGLLGSLAFGAALCLVLSLAGGLAVSVAVGLASGVVGSLAFAIASLGPNLGARTVAQVVALGLANGIAGSLIFNAASAAPGHRINYSPIYSSTRQVGGIIVGLMIGFVGSMLAGSLALFMARPAVLGLAGGVAVGVAVGWRTQPWRGLAVGLGFGLVVATIRLLPANVAGPGLLSLANTALLAALFALSYTLADRIAGLWAGAVAGALGSGAFFFSIMGIYFDWLLLYLGVACILLGLTFSWWRPILFYPFLTAWNLLLYRADRATQQFSAQSLTPAFCLLGRTSTPAALRSGGACGSGRGTPAG